MIEDILFRFMQAEDDLYKAVKLGEEIIYGQIEIELIDLMEMYYLLRKWKVRIGDGVLNSLEALLTQYETVLENIDSELLADYFAARKIEDIKDAVIEAAAKLGLPELCLVMPNNMPEA